MRSTQYCITAINIADIQ